MKIPKKITPDRIKDSIIEIKYNSKVPFEIITGIFFNLLDDTYQYTNRPLGVQQLGGALPVNFVERLELQIGSRPLFYNDKIKIELQPNSIIFNCLKQYINWDIFKPEIATFLTQLSKGTVIDSYTRVGVRYISEYPGMDLSTCVKFSFSFGLPDIKSDSYSFHSEFKQEDFKIILNLNNNLTSLAKQASTNQFELSTVSNIDIDIILENISETSLDGILEKIERAHFKEKEIFFNLLEEKFLETLNPVY